MRAEQYFYACKCKGEKYDFKQIKKQIELLHEVEMYNAKKANPRRVRKTIQKWASYTGVEEPDMQPGPNNTIEDIVLDYIAQM